MPETVNTVATPESVTPVAAQQPEVQTAPVTEQAEQQKTAELPPDDVASEPSDYSNETHFEEGEDFFTDGEPEQTPLPESAEAEEDNTTEAEQAEVVESEPAETVEKQPTEVTPEPKSAVTQEEPSQSMIDTVNERIRNEVKEDYIPNTKEFRDGVRKEAKQAVIDELGADEFDPYDDEHQILFLEKAQQISQRRTNAYNAAVNKFQTEYRQKEYQIKQQNFRNDLNSQVTAILNTPEKLAALDAAIDGISYKAYKTLQQEIAQGNGQGLLKLAKAVANKMGVASQQKAAKQNTRIQQNKTQPVRKESDDDYVTEEFFGW